MTWQENFKDINDEIRSHNSQDRQYNDQKKKDKKKYIDLKNTTQKTKDRATRNPTTTVMVDNITNINNTNYSYGKIKPQTSLRSLYRVVMFAMIFA